jgi:hypothetical protein
MAVPLGRDVDWVAPYAEPGRTALRNRECDSAGVTNHIEGDQDLWRFAGKAIGVLTLASLLFFDALDRRRTAAA